ncbi:MAG: N-6 DNA methylase [Ignavibacteria bacterium]|nr:N-6 DNA methylase [Ignavibacteria bacterium]
MLKEYLKKISKTTSLGDAREESYYIHLSNLISEFAVNTGKKETHITILPKKTEAGNPDFRIWDGKQHIVGYIEAKKPGDNLDDIENSEQLERYRSTFPNLILTNFYEFRLYRNGSMTDKVSIGRYFLAEKLQTVPPVENESKFDSLIEKFFSFSFPKVFSAETLAVELAKRTGFLRDEVVAKELEEEEKGKGKIYGFYTAFKQYLVSNLTHADFADIYSQTITYGLFAARTRADGDFNRKTAYDLIPQTIGILRDVFHFISLGKLSQQMEVIVDDISEVLHAADVNKILDEFYRKGKGEDPIVHFYETFLNVYDPAAREKRGVYYTPEPVVKYIIRSVHSLLKSHFDLNDGLANKEVTLLDPAGGTLTFPAEAIKLAVKEFTEKYGDAGKNKFIKNQILKNFYSFELMMAPYAIGHIKISFLLEELGYQMKEDDRFKLYLTNTLDMEDLQQTEIPGLESLSDESHLAANVKKNEPILVIVGNPPYSGHSANQNDWTENLLKNDIDGAQSYYTIDGESLGEKNPKWLQDDYVKFLRFSQWKIHKAGQGIVGMITNHSYLDNPTFRGMRQSLINTFNEIYIIDLHGNSLKKETCPDGGKDENVFDIMQGVSIAIMVKKKNVKGCKVYHRDIFGLREEKYNWLGKKEFKKKDYNLLKPKTPWYFLIERDTDEIEYYNKWLKVNDIFPVNSVGIVTARDNLTINWSASEMLNTVRLFGNMDIELARQTYKLGKDARDWKVSLAQEDLKQTGIKPENIRTILYRPFDTMFTYYTGNSRGFHCMPRGEVMQHMLKDNIGLTVGRQGQVAGTENLWNLAFISEDIIDFNLFYRGGELLFPLYLYPSEHKKKSLHNFMLFESDAEYKEEGRKVNIAGIVLEKLSKTYKTLPSPEEILGYVYAVLYSNVYREKYSEFLKIDFPRIPFTKKYALFNELSAFGSELIELHLLKHKYNPIVKYRGRGTDDTIEKPVYSEADNTVSINETKYFEYVTPEVWNYHIGGYQVMEKYLKDRKGRQMDDPGHYCRMAMAISKTIELQKNIDKVFIKAEKDIIDFN